MAAKRLTAYDQERAGPSGVSLGNGREQGLTLIEIIIAMLLATVGIVSLAGVLLSVQRGYEQASVRSPVVERAVSVLEEIKGSDPSRIVQDYDGNTYQIEGITGANPDGSVIAVSVDQTNPKLVVVTVDASWIVLDNVETTQLQTEVYSLNGQQ